MKFNRTKNASRNIIVGLAQRLYQILVPFLMRTAMLYLLGVEYLGLDGLFTSILSVLNLAELGVGSAMVYSMYKPVAEDDTVTICALMRLYKIYYRIIGLVVLVSGLILCPFVPKLISGSVPAGINVYVLFLLNLAATVLSYWLFAYKNSLFQAYQRADMVSGITMAVNTVRYILQFLLLFIFRNYYMYLIVTLASQAAINVATAWAANKMFPGLNPKGALPKTATSDINRRIRDLFTAKLGAVVVNSVDTLVISAFLGLTVLAIYQNYYFIVTAVLSIANIVVYSCMAGIGNSIVVETKEKNFADLKTFTFIISGIACFCTACLLGLFQPFMKLWAGEELMFEYPAVICFSVYFFIVEINTLLNMYKDAAGIWHEDRFRPLITAIVNLAMNLISVHFWGIYGVLLSTVLSMLLVGMPWLLRNLFTTLFPAKFLLPFLWKLGQYVLVSAVCCELSIWLGSLIPLVGLALMIARGMICFAVTGIVFILCFRRSEEFRRGLALVDTITRGKLKLQQRLIKK